MGMPIIRPGKGSRKQAITDLIESVALQETALSHILNAEGEKMQAIIAMEDTTPEDLLEMNCSVNNLINVITRLEMMFLSKLELFADQAADDPTTAAEELAKINVPYVIIDVPLDDPNAELDAIAQALAAAQAQVDPGYTVSFTPTSYDPTTGTLVGSFTVVNNTNPSDTATDTADQNIGVTSTATTAAQELANINVSSVTIPVPLTDPTAEQYAITQAVLAAQAQVDPAYTVTFTPSTGLDPVNATLTGTFTVTNASDPADTATDTTDRVINVVYTPSTAVATSNSAAQFLGGTLIGGDLTPITGIDGVTAYYENGVTAGTNDTNTTNLDLSSFGATPIVVNSVSMNLSDFVLELGVANQYAQASVDGASRAFSGAVSDNGVVSIGGSTDFPADASLNLMDLIPATPLLTEAELTVGAVIGAAQWSASVGNTIAPTTDVTNPVQGRSYNIAGATLDLSSPLLIDLVDTFDNIASDASTAVSNLGTDIVNGLLGGVDSVMSSIDALLPGVSILSNTLSVDVSLVDLSTELAPIFQTPITSNDGALTINFSAGTVDIDLNALLGLNGLPPNTSLLSPTVIDAMVADLNEILQSLQALVQAVIMSKLTGTAEVTISGGIELISLPAAGIDISYSGTLADLLTNASPLVISGTGGLALLTPGLQPLITTIQTALGAALDPLINDPTTGILPAAINTIASDITSVSNQLGPLFTLISDAISIMVNVQEDNADGPNTFTEIPIQLNLISGNVALNLGKVVVGPNTYTA